MQLSVANATANTKCRMETGHDAMLNILETSEFPTLNRAYNAVFRPGKLSIGLVVPLEAYPSTAEPTMERHVERVQLAEHLGFSRRLAPRCPVQCPYVRRRRPKSMIHLFISGSCPGRRRRLPWALPSIILPLRHPAHVAKAAASADVLSDGRLLLGVASGDRPEEYPALNMSFEDRGARFRECVDYIRSMDKDYPAFDNQHGFSAGAMDMLPKPVGGRLPLLITSGSQQSPDWIARNGDGWMTYPRSGPAQATLINDYRQRIEEAGEGNKPVMQSLYIDLTEDDESPPMPIHLGFRSGVSYFAALPGRASQHRHESCRHQSSFQYTRRRKNHETSGR